MSLVPAAYAQWNLSLRASRLAVTAGQPVGFVVVDVNGDGRADPVIPTTNRDLVTLLAAPDLSFSRETATLANTPSSIASGELNAFAPGSGGRPDLLIGSAADVATILLNQPAQTGQARWQTPSGTTTSWSTNSNASIVSIVDFEDGQSNPSLLASSGSTKKSTSRTGDGSGGFPGEDTLVSPVGSPEKMAFADINGDAKRDMVVLSPDTGVVSIYPFVKALCCPNPYGSALPPGGVEWGAPTLLPLTPGWSRTLAAADVIGDAKPEILVSLPSPVGSLGGPTVFAYSMSDAAPVRAFSPARTTFTEDVAAIVAFNTNAAFSNDNPDILALATASAQNRFIRSLGTLGSSDSFQGTVVDISDSGSVVVGNSAGSVAWHWRAPATRTTLAIPSGYASIVVTRVSGDGNTVVGEAVTPAGARRAFRWTAASGTVILPEVAGYEGVAMSAAAVSFDGTVVAGLLDQLAAGYSDSTGFVWTSTGASSRRVPDIMAGVGIADTGYPSVARDVSADGTLLICTDAAGSDIDVSQNTVIRLPGGAAGPSVSPLSNDPFAGDLQPYALRRITGDGVHVIGNAFYSERRQLTRTWDVYLSATAAAPSDAITYDQGFFQNGGFGDIYYTGARVTDVGASRPVWCGVRYTVFGSPVPVPDVPASAFTIAEWSAINSDGSIAAGTGTSAVGGVSGTWPVRRIGGTVAPLNITNVSARVRAISASGLFGVGSTTDSTGTFAVRKALNAAAQTLGDLAGGPAYSDALAINASGDVIVGESDSFRGREAFRWTPSGMVGLGDLPGGSFSSSARAVNALGDVVVGQSSSTRGTQAFKWTDLTGMVPLGYLNALYPFSTASGMSADGNTIIGDSRVSSNAAQQHAFRKVGNAAMQSLGTLDASNNYSSASAITPDGNTVVGQSRRADGGLVAFRWTSAGGMTELGGLANGASPIETYARAIAANADVVVGDAVTPQGSRAWIWTSATGVQDLNTFLSSRGVNLSGWTLTRADGLSANGDFIVGRGLNSLGLEDGFVVRWLPQGQASTVSIFTRSGGVFRETYDTSISLPGDASIIDMTAADLDGDGRRDLAVVMNDGQVHVIKLEPAAPADFNHDTDVDALDFDAFVEAFDAGLHTADINRDGFIDFDDFDVFVSALESGT
jgi:probable HAF family extracellular repeat protein